MKQRVLDGDFYDLLEAAADVSDALTELRSGFFFEGPSSKARLLKALVDRLWSEYAPHQRGGD